MTNNNLHPQDARRQSIMNREIASKQRYFSKARHSRFWTSARFIADRESAMPQQMGRHRARPAETVTELPMPL